MTPTMQDEMTKIISNDLGISALPAEKQQELIGQFGEIALKAATLAIIEKLGETKRDAFMKLSEQGSAEVLQTFLNRELPDHDAIVKAAVAEEAKRFKEFNAA